MCLRPPELLTRPLLLWDLRGKTRRKNVTVSASLATRGRPGGWASELHATTGDVRRVRNTMLFVLLRVLAGRLIGPLLSLLGRC